MMLTMILYPPSAGGNHLKNILCLDQSWNNSSDLDIVKVYYENLGVQIGEVQSVPGRNVRAAFIDSIVDYPGKDYILQCHFGEIAPYRTKIQQVKKQVILLTIDDCKDRAFLNRRQHRLGQHIHPYWLDEELPYVYQPLMCERYFDIDPGAILPISVTQFWQRNITDLVLGINEFTKKNIDLNQAQNLHDRWHKINQNLLDK